MSFKLFSIAHHINGNYSLMKTPSTFIDKIEVSSSTLGASLIMKIINQFCKKFRSLQELLIEGVNSCTCIYTCT